VRYCENYEFLGHGDDLIDLLLEVASVCPSVLMYVCMYVFPSIKSCFDFSLIWYVSRYRPDMSTSVTSTRFKVKVKVTELLKLRKLYFSTSIFSAVLAWSSKLMVDSDSMALSLQLSPVFEFPSRKLSREFKLRRMSIFYEIQMAIFC